MNLGKKIRTLHDWMRFSLNLWCSGYKFRVCVENFTWVNLRHLVIANMDVKLAEAQVSVPFISPLLDHCPQFSIRVMAFIDVASIYSGLDSDDIKLLGPVLLVSESVSMVLPGKHIDELSFDDIKAEFFQLRFDDTASLLKE